MCLGVSQLSHHCLAPRWSSEPSGSSRTHPIGRQCWGEEGDWPF